MFLGLNLLRAIVRFVGDLLFESPHPDQGDHLVPVHTFRVSVETFEHIVAGRKTMRVCPKDPLTSMLGPGKSIEFVNRTTGRKFRVRVVCNQEYPNLNQIPIAECWNKIDPGAKSAADVFEALSTIYPPGRHTAMRLIEFERLKRP